MTRFMIVIICLLVLAILAVPAWSSGCSGGPWWPMCSGRILAETGSENCQEPECPILRPGQSCVFSLYCPDSDMRGISSYRFGLASRFEVGVGYAWDNDKVLGSANYLVRLEDKNTPSVTFGIGSRRTGGSDSSALLSAGKSLAWKGKAIRLNCGLAYTLKESSVDHQMEMAPGETMDSMDMGATSSHKEPRAGVVAGVGVSLGAAMAGGLQYDGQSLHAMLMRRVKSVNVGLMLLEMKDLGLSVSYSLGGPVR